MGDVHLSSLDIGLRPSVLHDNYGCDRESDCYEERELNEVSKLVMPSYRVKMVSASVSNAIIDRQNFLGVIFTSV